MYFYHCRPFFLFKTLLTSAPVKVSKASGSPFEANPPKDGTINMIFFTGTAEIFFKSFVRIYLKYDAAKI
jgi:hypothetical protein